jgi:DNA polymerase III alpha subunit
MLLEDEHAQVNLIVPPQVYDRHRGVIRGEPLVLAKGRYEVHDRNRNILVREIVSLGPLARELTDGADVHASLPAAHHFGHR